jgi:protein-L-isoaspartate(D-aspartate) O-methyltransferase
MSEFNLLQNYPRTKRGNLGRVITPHAKKVAERLDFDYFDGDRKFGFGGYNYDGRWQAVASLAKKRYHLNKKSVVLIDRSDKAFLIFDLKNLIPGITIYGTHRTDYPINHSMEGYGKYARINVLEDGDPRLIEHKAREEISPFLIKADLWNLPFKDNFFDTVISINNVCAYDKPKHLQAIREIMRVSKNNGEDCYIQNDSWKNEHQEEMLIGWSLLCKVFLGAKEWEKLYRKEGYNGDWGFTIIE